METLEAVRKIDCKGVPGFSRSAEAVQPRHHSRLSSLFLTLKHLVTMRCYSYMLNRGAPRTADMLSCCLSFLLQLPTDMSIHDNLNKRFGLKPFSWMPKSLGATSIEHGPLTVCSIASTLWSCHLCRRAIHKHHSMKSTYGKSSNLFVRLTKNIRQANLPVIQPTKTTLTSLYPPLLQCSVL